MHQPVSFDTPPGFPHPTEAILWAVQAAASSGDGAAAKELRRRELEAARAILRDLFPDAFEDDDAEIQRFCLFAVHTSKLIEFAKRFCNAPEPGGRAKLRLSRLTKSTAEKYISAVASAVASRRLTPREGTALMYAAQLQLAIAKRAG